MVECELKVSYTPRDFCCGRRIKSPCAFTLENVDVAKTQAGPDMVISWVSKCFPKKIN